MTMRTNNGVNTHNGHEFVDLGLPSGTLWATCNVGATSPEQAGLYFAFGETTGYSAEQVEKGIRRFNKTSYKAKKITSDLTLEEDAAHVCMGGKWRMPTMAECQELIDNCDAMWTENYGGTGVKGSVFTSRVNGNSVFLPAAGVCSDSSVINVGSVGYVCSASWNSFSGTWYLYFNSGNFLVDYLCYYWYFGYSVRGVCKR